MNAKQLVRRVADRLHPGLGCSDAGCVFGHRGGMATNGGCECLKEREPVYLRRTILALSDIARVLASMVNLEDEPGSGRNRDPEHPCADFVHDREPIGQDWCQGDGHHLCRECVHHDSKMEPRT